MADATEKPSFRIFMAGSAEAWGTLRTARSARPCSHSVFASMARHGVLVEH